MTEEKKNSCHTEISVKPVDTASLDKAKEKLQRDLTSHKGDHGHILIVAGSYGSSGAAILAARGALRTGAGLVTITATKSNNAIFQQAVPEAMTLPLAASNKFLDATDWPLIKEKLERYDAVVLGPGLGMHPQTMELVLHLFHESKCPAIVDADALNTIAASRKKLHSPRGIRIYTPHAKEMGRLLKCSTKEIVADRFAAVKKAHHIFAGKKHPAIMLLKGAGTIIYDGTSFYTNTTGNPAMATGGMGDVLSGVIAALTGQGLDALMATCCGAYLHGLAADILAQRMGVGFSATEVANTLPAARKCMYE